MLSAYFVCSSFVYIVVAVAIATTLTGYVYTRDFRCIIFQIGIDVQRRNMFFFSIATDLERFFFIGHIENMCINERFLGACIFTLAQESACFLSA